MMNSPRRVREPVQVYLAADDRDLLNRLTVETGLSKAEILRRGVRSFAKEKQNASPMLQFLESLGDIEAPEGTAVDHDAVLAESYLSPRLRRR
jgi:hypothetical protein